MTMQPTSTTGTSPAASSADRRIFPRRSVQTEGWIAEPQENIWASICLLDISAGGIALLSRTRLEPKTSRVFRVQLPDSGKIFSVIARITSCLEHSFLAGYRIGAQFTTVDTDDVQAIQAFVEATLLDEAA